MPRYTSVKGSGANWCCESNQKDEQGCLTQALLPEQSCATLKLLAGQSSTSLDRVPKLLGVPQVGSQGNFPHGLYKRNIIVDDVTDLSRLAQSVERQTLITRVSESISVFI